MNEWINYIIYYFWNFNSQQSNMQPQNGDKKKSKVTKLPDDQAAGKDTHAYMVIDTKFDIDKRYEIIDPIGQGAYGVVVAAKDLSV